MCEHGQSCCLRCHFRYEEKHAFPHLPVRLRALIAAQHHWLEENGFPAEMVHNHAQSEMRPFRRYCPPDVVERIERDHVAYGRGALKS